MRESCRCFFLLLLVSIAFPVRAAAEIPVTGRAEPDLSDFDQMMLRFMREHQVPGASLAIAHDGKLVYARGFGWSDVENKIPVQPGSLFRIASVSKPFTAAAILQLQERGKLKLGQSAFEIVDFHAHLEPGQQPDPRLRHITIAELLHHSAGFDRDASFDPMFRTAEIARAMHVDEPPRQDDIVRFMMGRPLDFAPGTKEVYSNFGYCVLGRVVERVSGLPYEQYMQQEILKPLGIGRMKIGESVKPRPGEVHYYPHGNPQVRSVFPPHQKTPVAYGGWCIEAMDAHGGWIASAPEVVRFASSLNDAERCPILNAHTITEIFARPAGTGFEPDGKPKVAYYACGWEVRPVEAGKANTWHTGRLDGSASLVVRRFDGLTWAVLFNADSDAHDRYLAGLIDPLIHPVADGIRHWPAGGDFDDAEAPN